MTVTVEKSLMLTHFYNPNKRLGIWVLNDWKFMNPKFFDKDEVNSVHGRALDIWNKIDARKKEMMKQSGIKIHIVWESELKKQSLTAVIVSILGIPKTELKKLFESFFDDDKRMKESLEEYDFDYKMIYEKYIRKDFI